MASGMVDYSPHGFGSMWGPDGSSFGMTSAWDSVGFGHGLDMGFTNSYPQMSGHGYPSPTIPQGVPKDLHEEAHHAGMQAYQQMYQTTVEKGLLKLQAKEAKEAKEKKAAPKPDSSNLKDSEPMKISVPGMQQNKSKQPAPPPNAPSTLPSKPLPPPPNHDVSGTKTDKAEALIGAPPGLMLPPGCLGMPEPPPPPGLLERAVTFPLTAAAGASLESIKKSSLITGPAMQALGKTSEGTMPFQWSVDARKLKTSDKVIVSPSFEWPEDEADSAKFKLMIIPKAVNDKKGGSSFKKAKGKAVVEVKCEANPPKKEVKLRLAVTDKENPKMLKEFRGPVVHNFSEANICNMKVPHCDEEWDLPYDNTEPTFLVRLEIYDEDDDSD